MGHGQNSLDPHLVNNTCIAFLQVLFGPLPSCVCLTVHQRTALPSHGARHPWSWGRHTVWGHKWFLETFRHDLNHSDCEHYFETNQAVGGYSENTSNFFKKLPCLTLKGLLPTTKKFNLDVHTVYNYTRYEDASAFQDAKSVQCLAY